MKVTAISHKSSLFVFKGFLLHSFNAPGYEITSSPYELTYLDGMWTNDKKTLEA